jgi:hypothetical protein
MQSRKIWSGMWSNPKMEAPQLRGSGSGILNQGVCGSAGETASPNLTVQPWLFPMGLSSSSISSMRY